MRINNQIVRVNLVVFRLVGRAYQLQVLQAILRNLVRTTNRVVSQLKIFKTLQQVNRPA